MENINNLKTQIDNIFSEWDDFKTPGCVLGIIHEGELIFQGAYGMADLDLSVPLNINSVFDVGSIAKQFTAACVLLLIQDGLLHIDEDVRKYIPELPDYGTTISIRSLIHHTNGLRDYLQIIDLAGISKEDYFDNQDVLDIIIRQKYLNHNPGDKFLYTNSGYALLAEIIYRLTGKTLGEFAKEQIFIPLKMEHTQFDENCKQITPGRVTSYRKTSNGSWERYAKNDTSVGASGLISTISDLYKWDQNFYKQIIGGENFTINMQTCDVLNDGTPSEYAFGLNVSKYRSLKTVNHAGAYLGFRAEFLRFPEQNFSVVCLANSDTILTTRLAYKVADLCLANQLSPLNENKTETIVLETEELHNKTGLYQGSVTEEIVEIYQENGELKSKTGERVFRLTPVKYANDIVEFHVQDIPIVVQVIFTRLPESKKWQIKRVMPGMGEEIFNPVETAFMLSETELEEYMGKYASPELKTTWVLKIENGNLVVKYSKREKDETSIGSRDVFYAPYITFQFTRDDSGIVSGILVNTERVKNLFLKRL